MNQYMLYHFTINKNDRVFQLIIQPGTPWEDLEEVMAEFTSQFLQIKAEAKAKEEAQAENKGE